VDITMVTCPRDVATLACQTGLLDLPVDAEGRFAPFLMVDERSACSSVVVTFQDENYEELGTGSASTGDRATCSTGSWSSLGVSDRDVAGMRCPGGSPSLPITRYDNGLAAGAVSVTIVGGMACLHGHLNAGAHPRRTRSTST
jgi:hypothetical protein